MTRAKQRLYLLGSTKDCERRLWFMPNSASRVWQGQSMLDWIMCMLMDDPALRKDYTEQLQLKKPLSTGHPQAANHWKIKVFDLYSSQPVEKRKVIHNILPQLEASVSGTSVDELGKRWEHMYKEADVRAAEDLRVLAGAADARGTVRSGRARRGNRRG